jgi:hypothetical protein
MAAELSLLAEVCHVHPMCASSILTNLSVNMGVIIGLTAGLYQALNLLGAGGGKPSSFETVQIVNSTLCAVWFFSSAFSGTVLNTIGPALSSCLGVGGFMLYVGGLWYFDASGKNWFAILGGVAIGVSSPEVLSFLH